MSGDSRLDSFLALCMVLRHTYGVPVILALLCCILLWFQATYQASFEFLFMGQIYYQTQLTFNKWDL